MKKILTAIFIFFVFFAQAQQIATKEWMLDFPQISNMTVCDMMQTCNGQFIVLVGYRGVKSKNREDNTEGVVLVADAKTGAFVRQKSFKFREQNRNSFIHVVETLNKNWLLVGKSGNNSQASIGWIVRVKPTLESVEEKQFGVGGDNFFEKIAQKSDGTNGFFGQRSEKDGLLVVEYKSKWRETITQTERLGDLLAVSADTLGRWQVAGAAINYGSWWSRVTEDGLTRKQARSAYKPDIKAADISADQLSYFFGTSWEKGAANIWIARLDTVTNADANSKSNKLIENLYSKKNEAVECITATNAQNGSYYLAVSTTKGNSDKAHNKIVIFDGTKLNLDTPLSADLDFSDNFVINGLTMGLDKTLWVWGETMDKYGEKMVKVAKLRTADIMSSMAKSKGGNDLENLFAVKSELSDESQTSNNTLEPNETGTLLLNLTNISGQNIPEITVQAKSPKWVGLDVELESNTQKLKGKTAIFGFNIIGKPNLMAGTPNLIFTISVNGQVRQELSVPIHCGTGTAIQAKHEVWYNDANFNQGDRSKSALSPSIEIKGEARPNKPLPSPNAQPTVVVKKSNRAKDELPVKTSNPYINTINGLPTYPFKVNFNLEDGLNVIVIETNFGDTILTDTLRIMYNLKVNPTEQPKMHVIAIAPAYRDNALDFNINDVEDFVARMKKQEGGLYSKVLIQKYITYDSTDCTTIKSIFRDLPRRCAPDYDKPDAIGKRDIIVVLFSSHGKIIRNQFKIIPSKFNDTDEEEAIETSVDYKKEVLEKLEKVVADTINEASRKVLVLIDACHSGGAKSRDIINPELSNRLNALNSAAPGIITLSSTTEGLLSYEDKEWKNGAFTEALLEAFDNKTIVLLDGTVLKADTPEAGLGYLSINEIFNFLQKRIPDLFLKHEYMKGLKQVPFMPTKKLDGSIPMFKL